MKSVRLLPRLLIAWSLAELLVAPLACFSFLPNLRPTHSLVLGMTDLPNVLPEISIPPTNLTWKGLSRAGEATSFVIPELRWMFDCGRVDVHWKPTCIFLTHTHADHVQALAHVLFSRNSATTTTHVYLPVAAESMVQAHLQAFYDMIRDDDDDENTNDNFSLLEQLFSFQLCPTPFHEEFTLPKQRKGGNLYRYVVRPIECDHRKISVGYSIFRNKHSVLKPEYRHLTGPELGALRQTTELRCPGPVEPVLCFLGDTTSAVFDRHPELLRQHHTLAVECTFYEPSDRERAATTKHMHWDDLAPVMAQHPSVLFVLQHFSLRHDDRQWREWIRAYNSESSSNNAHPMLPAASKNNGDGETETPSCNCRVCQPRSDG